MKVLRILTAAASILLTTRSSETPVHIDQTTRRCTQDDSKEYAVTSKHFSLRDNVQNCYLLTQFLHLLTYLLTPWSRVLLEKLASFRS
jgi:hypothetical protein